MKLFVKNKQKPNDKIYLSLTADSRQELVRQLGSPYFSVNGMSYSVDEVFAESKSQATPLGAILGGIIGLAGGPIGVVIGGVAGGALGTQQDQSEISKAINFNNSSSLQRR